MHPNCNVLLRNRYRQIESVYVVVIVGVFRSGKEREILILPSN